MNEFIIKHQYNSSIVSVGFSSLFVVKAASASFILTDAIFIIVTIVVVVIVIIVVTTAAQGVFIDPCADPSIATVVALHVIKVSVGRIDV